MNLAADLMRQVTPLSGWETARPATQNAKQPKVQGRRTGAADAVHRALQVGPEPVAVIARRTGIPPLQVARSLAYLASIGKAKRCGYGVYCRGAK